MPTNAFEVDPSDAVGPLVLALDVGSGGSRGALYDVSGRPLSGSDVKVHHAFTTAADGTSVIDANQVTHELRVIIAHVSSLARQRIEGVALDTFASSLVGVDAAGRAVTPCFTYADSRPVDQVARLRAELDEDAVQQRTGTRQATGYLPARLRWLADDDAERFARVDRWMSLGEYAYLHFLGTTAAGTSTAAWTGMLDRRTCTWDAELCRVAGVRPEQLSPIAHPDAPLTPVGPLDRGFEHLASAVWFAPITDGHASSLGADAKDPSTVVLAAATSGAMRRIVTGDPDVPRGLWCYRIDAERSLLGGALNDVGRVYSWLESTLQLPEPEVLADALAADPRPDLPLALPFLTGERATGWNGRARVALTGVHASTTPADLVRAFSEGIAWSYDRVLDALSEVDGRPASIIGTGSVALSRPCLLTIIADATGVGVRPLLVRRSTLRGTALHALEVLAPDAERYPLEFGPTCEPRPEQAAYYADRARALTSLYEDTTR